MNPPVHAATACLKAAHAVGAPGTEGGAQFLAMSGDFEASALLVDGFWEGPAGQFVAGDVYALAPARDMLGFCSMSSARGIAELQAMQARCAQSELNHALHNHMLVRQSGRWSWAQGR